MVKNVTLVENRNTHCFYRYIGEKLSLQNLVTEITEIKKWTLSLCKFDSFFEEIPEEFSDETDVDSFFYHHLFDKSQSQHQKIDVSKGSNKKSFVIKLVQLCDLTTRQRDILQKQVIISKSELSSLVDSLRDFLRTFDNTADFIHSQSTV